MTEAEFKRAGEILAQLQTLQVDRDIWASVNTTENANAVRFIGVGNRPLQVPPAVLTQIRTAMLRVIDTQMTALTTEFAAL